MLCGVLQLIRDPFLLAVSDTLGDRYTAHMENIYQKAIDFILNTLQCGFTGQLPEGSAVTINGDTAVKDASKNTANPNSERVGLGIGPYGNGNTQKPGPSRD
jgi:type 1 fimbria pilin